jgi:predicted enzyme related to lactoylglutathione lyase
MGIFVDGNNEGVGCVAYSEHMKPSEQGAVIYLDATPGFDAVLDRVKQAGGRIVMDKMELPRELGYIAHFIDTEGNRVALHAEH